MIKILINERKGIIDIEGHANLDIRGKDIICAGVSAITFGIIKYFENVQEAERKLKVNDKDQFVTKISVSGEGKVKIKYDINNFSIFFVMKNVIEGMYLQFDEEIYKPYISIEVIEKNARTKNQFR